ncbi:MAG: hypothetical protein ABIR32_03420 [Ilumatobacteraceae bacterium]
MRQFFSWRFWATLASLLGLVVLLKVVLPADATKQAVPTGPPDRTIDFVSLVYGIQPANRFFILDGIVNGSADVIIDGQRTMHIVEGTPGAIDCPAYREIGRCIVVADLLGDAVIWFDLVPREPNEKVNAAPIVDILDGGFVRLANGWVIKAVNSIDRRCKQETGSLREFVDTYGPSSTTIIDVATQRVTAVVCSDTDATETTVSTVADPAVTSTIALPTSTIAAPDTTVPAAEPTILDPGATLDSLLPEG